MFCSGRTDYRSSGNRDDHPSGLPRPYGGGRGRGRGSYNSRGNHNGRQDSGFNSARWGSVTKDGDDGLSNFPGAKVQNSPGREAFPGGWGSGAASGWGSGDGAGDADQGSSGWGSGLKKSDDGWSANAGGGTGW